MKGNNNTTTKTKQNKNLYSQKYSEPQHTARVCYKDLNKIKL